jgi:hypothetical protein
MNTRTKACLSAQLDKKVESYLTDASANSTIGSRIFAAASLTVMGLGSLTIPEALHAEVVFTPANHRIGVHSGEARVSVDVNHDGINDLVFSAYNLFSFSSGFHVRQFLSVREKNGSRILEAGNAYAAADVAGRLINSNGQFGTVGVMADCINSGSGGGSTFHSSRGLWLNVKNRFLGFEFAINGEVHYGWARLSATCGQATLTGLARGAQMKAVPAEAK